MSYLPGPNSTLQVALSSRSIGTVVLESGIDVFISLAALIGNSLVLFIIYKKPSLRTIPNYFVIALAVSDVAMALLVKPWSIATLIKGHWIFDFELCQFQGFTSVFLASFSLNILTVMAVNRYCGIVKQTLQRNFFNARKTQVSIFFTAVFGVLAALPHLLAGHIYEFHPGKFFCYQQEVLWSTMYLMVVYIAVPAVIIIICYLQVFLTIRKHQKQLLKTFQQGGFRRITAEDIKVTYILFATVVAFILCWMPVFVVEMADLVRGGATLPRQVYVMFTMCATTSSVVNPIIYGVMNRRFRKEYINLLKFRGVGHQSSGVNPGIKDVKIVRTKRMSEAIN